MQTTDNRNCVLTGEMIKRKLKRMALEVAERNSGESGLVIAGIEGNGVVVANLLQEELEKITGIKAGMVRVKMNKRDPLKISLDPVADVKDKTVIVVDDVANTGRTLLYALRPFLESYPRGVQTLVLVERSHKQFPVETDYKGLSISTTLQNHISVETDGPAITGAWLSDH